MGSGKDVHLTQHPRSPSASPTPGHRKAAEGGVWPGEPGVQGGPADLHFGVPAEPSGTQIPASQRTLGWQAWDQNRPGHSGDGEHTECGPRDGQARSSHGHG